MTRVSILARNVLLGLAVMVLLPTVVSCSGVDEIEWKEQVRLHSGAVIEVERRATRGGFFSGIPRSSRGPEYSYEICYRPMGVYWSSNAPYAPYVFDVVDGKPIIVIRLHNCLSCQIADYPELSTVVYRLDGGTWKQISASALPKTTNNNMLRMFWDAHESSKDVRGTVTLEQKQRRDAQLRSQDQDLWRWMETRGRTFCEECRKDKGDIRGTRKLSVLRDRGDSKFCL